MSILHKDEYVDDDIGVFHAHGEMLFILIPMSIRPMPSSFEWLAFSGYLSPPRAQRGQFRWVQMAPTGLPDVFHPDSTEFH